MVAGRAAAEAPLLRPAVSVSNSVSAISVGSYAIPCVADWNGDGRKDLLVGYQPDSKIAVFLNSGSDAQPAFTNSFRLQAGGAEIQHSSTGCGSPAPWVCDFDADGKRDLIVGNGYDGTVWFYRNTNTDAAPMLAAGTRLMTSSAAVSVPTRATPTVVDWDGDGLSDLLCGAGDGYVYFFKNTGAPPAPVYTAGTRMNAGPSLLFLDYRSVVRAFDWDGDGLRDLVCSSGTRVCWCRNVGSSNAPALLAPVDLRVPSVNGTLVPIYTGNRMRLDLADWNNDGMIDLLIGNVSGTIYLYEGYQMRFTAIQAEPRGGCVLQWSSAPYLKYQLWAGSSPERMSVLVASNLLSDGCVTRWTNQGPEDRCFYRVQFAP